jgi:hypothetical protein
VIGTLIHLSKGRELNRLAMNLILYQSFMQQSLDKFPQELQHQTTMVMVLLGISSVFLIHITHPA